MSDVEAVETESEGEGPEAQTSIDELFEPEVEDEPEAAPETEGEGEKDAEAEKPEQSATPADEEAVGLKAALTAERRKRQELEKHLADLSRPAEKTPDPIEDPQGYAAHLDQKRSEESYTLKVTISRELMMGLKEDYLEKEEVFVKLAEANPGLVAQVRAADNPAKFAYETAVDYMDIQRWRDPEQRKAAVHEEAKTLAAAMVKQQLAEIQGKKSALKVPNLAKAPAAGSNTVEVEKVDDLDTLFEGSAL